jgi:hypothetical protein
MAVVGPAMVLSLKTMDPVPDCCSSTKMPAEIPICGGVHETSLPRKTAESGIVCE